MGSIGSGSGPSTTSIKGSTNGSYEEYENMNFDNLDMRGVIVRIVSFIRAFINKDVAIITLNDI